LAYGSFLYGFMVLVWSLLGALFFGLQWWGSGKRWVGAGDIDLGAALGAICGPYFLLAIWSAYALACLSLLPLWAQNSLPKKIFLGPWLMISTLLGLLYPGFYNQIWSLIMSF
jgi:hypothetical protein